MQHFEVDTNFTGLERQKALAIVKIFETGRAFEGFAAFAVLDDGAGISYGVGQFTHRSGSLFAVAKRYVKNGGAVGRTVIEKWLPILASNTSSAIVNAASDRQLKSALQAAALTSEMRISQIEVLEELYLTLAIRVCSEMRFVLPLSLAVVCDSMVHGSWDRIRSRVPLSAASTDDLKGRAREHIWIRQYVCERHQWLGSIPRLRPTRYRTRFFIEQIVRGNWALDLPLNVHGVLLTPAMFAADSGTAETDIFKEQISAVGPPAATTTDASPMAAASGQERTSNSSDNSRGDAAPATITAQPSEPEESNAESHSNAVDVLRSVEAGVQQATAAYDRVESVINTVSTRSDAAKSMYTAIAGTVWQSVWAVCSFAIGLPRVVWLVAAVFAGTFAAIYLYRQIALGKIRETKQ